MPSLRPVQWLSARNAEHDNPLRVSVHDPTPDHDASFAEELFLLYDSPKPKGPQELPMDDYAHARTNSSLYGEDDSIFQPESPLPAERPHYPGLDPHALDPPHSPPLLAGLTASSLSQRKLFPPRKFQNLLQKGTSPFEMLDSDEENQLVDSYFAREPAVASPPQPPYPVADISLDSDDSADEANRSYNLRRAAFGTPTKIPALVDHQSMQSGPMSPEYGFVRSSPQVLTRYSSSPELLPRLDFSQPSSPSKSSLMRRLGQFYSTYVSESRSSRSPSPKKYGGSPVISKTGFYPIDNPESHLFKDDYGEHRIPRWSLIEHDDYYDYDDNLNTPLPTQFDYSGLPELPKLPEDSPNRNMTVKSTMSFLNRESDPFLPSTPTLMKKNAGLPPVPLDLPALPFSSSALSRQHFAACGNVWSLREIFSWCIKLSGWLHDQQITQKELKKSMIKLFVYHKRDVPIDLIGRNVTQVLNTFIASGAIILTPSEDSEEPLVSFERNNDISGVLVDLTPCYCRDEDHFSDDQVTKKCYSSHCQINKVIEHDYRMKNTDIHSLVLGSDWASHWKLTAEDMNMDPSISKRQSFLFDLIKFEQTFIQRAKCFVDIVGPEFIRSAKLLVGPNAIVLMTQFETDILTPAQELVKVHQEVLFEPLLKILISDGRIITSVIEIANLYDTWAHTVRVPLLKYMSTVPMIEDLLTYEALKSWDQALRNNPRVKELQVNGNMLLMSTFNSRYQQLPLQLLDIRKFYELGEEEYTQLTKAVESIKKLGNKVNEMKVHADNIHALKLIEKQLLWKSNIPKPNINLSSQKRKFFYRGNLIRKGDLKINSSTVHLIVLDHYVLITERQRNQRSFSYKVTEVPIPMDYLIVENREKEASGLSVKTATSPSMNGTPIEAEDDSFVYPFKIRYAGQKGETHTLIAATEQDRKKWFSIFLQVKSNLIRKVSSVAPYDLKLIDNSYYAYEQANRITKLPILPGNDSICSLASTTKQNLLTRGLRGSIYSVNLPRNLFVYKRVQCSEMFTFMNAQFHFIGTGCGVYCSDERNMWKRIVNMTNVTKITVVPEVNVVLVLANKMLRYYPLQLLIDVYYEKKEKISSFQLSNEAVLFYEFGRHREVPTLFVAKKKNAGTTTFKVFGMELDNNGILSTFLVIKRFYIQAECYGISIFNKSLAVHTQRGFEILDLNKLSPRTVPELPPADIANKKIDGYGRKKNNPAAEAIRKAISPATAKPMGMFKLSSNSEFLLVYNECAIFVNRAGGISRTDFIKFSFRPKSIAFVSNNLVLVCEEVVEVWSISNHANGTPKLLQVIPNKDIQLLNAESLAFSVANPKLEGLQLLFRMSEKHAKILVPDAKRT